jgi:Domain of unkown function (DUF1775)
VFCDQSGFYVLPMVVRTYAPVGKTPVLHENLTRDHLSAMSAITLEGKLYMMEQERIGPREFQQFLVQAQAPEEPGEYPWRAIQTYRDGSVVKWTGPPDAEEPASVVKVVSGGTEGQGSEGGDAGEAGSDREGTVAGASTDTLAATGGTSPLVYAGLGAGILALGALLARRLIGS